MFPISTSKSPNASLRGTGKTISGNKNPPDLNPLNHHQHMNFFFFFFFFEIIIHFLIPYGSDKIRNLLQTSHTIQKSR